MKYIKTYEVTKKEKIKKGLSGCTEGEQMVFKRMYSHLDLDLPINDVVDNMNKKDLNSAMRQVQQTLDKKLKKAAKKYNL